MLSSSLNVLWFVTPWKAMFIENSGPTEGKTYVTMVHNKQRTFPENEMSFI